MKIGFGRSDVTPRVGVELCGFGPFLQRRSVGLRDRLWARAAAFELADRRVVLVSCDLIGVTASITARVRRLVGRATGLADDDILVHATHTHSGPAVGAYIGWGESDAPYLELLPDRIAAACIAAVGQCRPARLSHAEAPCEGIGLNREYDRDRPPLEDALRDDWRPAKPELTNLTAHVLRADADGRCLGFLSYYGCHPVVCCAATRQIHGDYCGVATNLVERDHPGAVGLFLQGAQGDINSCVVHQAEAESLAALDVIAARYARVIREGLSAARPIEVDTIRRARRQVTFHRKPWDRAKLASLLAEQEAVLHAPGADHADQNFRMAMVRATALRQLLAALEAGRSLEPPAELHGLRLGPLALLGAPLEVFRAIAVEATEQAVSPLPLVMGFTGDSIGYAVDRTAAARGGYAADLVPLVCGALPFADIHGELVEALAALDAALH